MLAFTQPLTLTSHAHTNCQPTPNNVPGTTFAGLFLLTDLLYQIRALSRNDSHI